MSQKALGKLVCLSVRRQQPKKPSSKTKKKFHASPRFSSHSRISSLMSLKYCSGSRILGTWRRATHQCSLLPPFSQSCSKVAAAAAGPTLATRAAAAADLIRRRSSRKSLTCLPPNAGHCQTSHFDASQVFTAAAKIRPFKEQADGDLFGNEDNDAAIKIILCFKISTYSGEGDRVTLQPRDLP